MSPLMNEDHALDLDRLIDEAAASMVMGEPQRVTTASVRGAIEATHAPRSRFIAPTWLALAALLIVAIGLKWLTASTPQSGTEIAASMATADQTPSVPAPTPRLEIEPRLVAAVYRRSGRVETLVVSVATQPSGEGIPSLTILPIEIPEPLTTPAIERQTIEIPRIEIAPLTLPAIASEQEH